MKYKIFIFRHSETTFNKQKRFTGWKDAVLTEEGIKQAKKIARKLKDENFEVAFQTRLSRSKDTLKEVLKYHPECKKILNDDRMIERSYGDYQGRSHRWLVKTAGEDMFNKIYGEDTSKFKHYEKEEIIEQLGKIHLQNIRRSYNYPPPNGESVKMVEERVAEFIKYLKRFIKENRVNVAISAHGNSMRPFRKYFEGLSTKEMMKLENPHDDYFEYEVKVND